MRNVEKYPNKFEHKSTDTNARVTRAVLIEEVIEPGKSKIGMATFISDAARAWNRSLNSLKDITTVYAAKKEIKKIALSLQFWVLSSEFD